MQRGEGRGVGNGLDGGRVDVVDDDRGILVQEPKQPEHYSTCNQNAKSIQQHSRSSRTRISNCYHGHDRGLASNTTSMLDARDNTVDNAQNYNHLVSFADPRPRYRFFAAAAAVGICTPRNTVYIFLLCNNFIWQTRYYCI